MSSLWNLSKKCSSPALFVASKSFICANFHLTTVNILLLLSFMSACFFAPLIRQSGTFLASHICLNHTLVFLQRCLCASAICWWGAVRTEHRFKVWGNLLWLLDRGLMLISFPLCGYSVAAFFIKKQRNLPFRSCLPVNGHSFKRS